MRFPTFVMGPSLTAQQVARFRPAKTNSAISSPSVGLSPNENRSRARQFILLGTLILAKIRLTEPCLNSHSHQTLLTATAHRTLACQNSGVDEIQSYPLGDTTLGLLHAAPMNSGGSYGSHIWEP
jgi:hypothetical protein